MESMPAQWEYCQLVFFGVRVPTVHPGPHVISAVEVHSQHAHAVEPSSSNTPLPPVPVEVRYDLEVVYAGPDGAVSRRQLTSFEQVRTQHPFYQALGLLGGAGWELVAMEPSHEHTWAVEDREVPYAAGMRPISRIVHFKRPVLPGRRVDEPAIDLSE